MEERPTLEDLDLRTFRGGEAAKQFARLGPEILEIFRNAEFFQRDRDGRVWCEIKGKLKIGYNPQTAAVLVSSAFDLKRPTAIASLGTAYLYQGRLFAAPDGEQMQFPDCDAPEIPRSEGRELTLYGFNHGKANGEFRSRLPEIIRVFGEHEQYLRSGDGLIVCCVELLLRIGYTPGSPAAILRSYSRLKIPHRQHAVGEARFGSTGLLEAPEIQQPTPPALADFRGKPDGNA